MFRRGGNRCRLAGTNDEYYLTYTVPRRLVGVVDGTLVGFKRERL